MAAATAYAEANSLFVDENYEAALKSYDKAIELDQQNVDYLLKRSACHLKLKHLEGKKTRWNMLDNGIEKRFSFFFFWRFIFPDAVADASTAVKLVPNNANAYLRKGFVIVNINSIHWGIRH